MSRVTVRGLVTRAPVEPYLSIDKKMPQYNEKKNLILMEFLKIVILFSINITKTYFPCLSFIKRRFSCFRYGPAG